MYNNRFSCRDTLEGGTSVKSPAQIGLLLHHFERKATQRKQKVRERATTLLIAARAPWLVAGGPTLPGACHANQHWAGDKQARCDPLPLPSHSPRLLSHISFNNTTMQNGTTTPCSRPRTDLSSPITRRYILLFPSPPPPPTLTRLVSRLAFSLSTPCSGRRAVAR